MICQHEALCLQRLLVLEEQLLFIVTVGFYNKATLASVSYIDSANSISLQLRIRYDRILTYRVKVKARHHQ